VSQAADASADGILKADALRFVTTFRSQIPKPELLAVFPAIVNLLRSEHNVVHSYAATCIERLLSMKVAAVAAPVGTHFRSFCLCQANLPSRPSWIDQLLKHVRGPCLCTDLHWP
jgi:Cse1